VKICSKCKTQQTEFYKDARMPDGLRPDCKECFKGHMKAGRKSNPELYQNQELKKHYGITVTQYKQMLADQGGGCKICGSRTGIGKRKLAVDHDHKTGQVRGVLCNLCNRGLGAFKDDPVLIQAAIAYLEKHQ
jgi:hypothetical protein